MPANCCPAQPIKDNNTTLPTQLRHLAQGMARPPLLIFLRYGKGAGL
jgi:hypothetical protein